MIERVEKGVNDLATVAPDVAEQWHPTKNGNLLPSEVAAGSNKKVWWMFPYDDPVTGKHFDFEWEATISNRVGRKSGCPFLKTNSKIWSGFNDLATVAPDIATVK
ncbi:MULTISPECIES: zinc-ribbon domain-containing protein [unclassified Butyrivibrio]|uniref:zinc-ribbon domain-containing protein n=1 Tax=unclassified Butyrivibrio TaxID=2639466 RepID=UPI000677C9CF|nr:MULTISPECIES: zinc-ribbon domain-containing protein [unclassified Butyrivibrio]